MMKKLIFYLVSIVTVISLIVAILLLCNKREYPNDIIIEGSVKNTTNSKVILHFSTWQSQMDLSPIVRKSRASSKFLFFNENGDLNNNFSVNREILCNPIIQINDVISYGYADFNLISDGKRINFLDDETNLNLSSMTQFGPQTSGYIETHNCAYYLLNLGSNAISGQYTTVLRFVNKNSSYDVIIPKSVYYISYDSKYDRFLYRVSDDVNNFTYGYIFFDKEQEKYVLNESKNIISKERFNKKYDCDSTGYGVLLDEDFAYELIICDINKTIKKECGISGDIINEEKAGVLILCKYNLIENAMSYEYVSNKIIYGDSSYGFVLSGTQNMPLTINNEKLYLFTRNNKIYTFDVKNNVKEYNLNFDFNNTINSSNPFDNSSSAGPTLGDGSPLIIDNGNIYTGHIYKNGIIKIHKYDFEKEEFELFWESSSSILSVLNKKSLEFISFEIID